MATALRSPSDRRDRLVSAAAVAAVHAALGWALLTGLGVSVPRIAEDALATFDVHAPPPPQPVVPPPETKPKAKEREGRASPPNLKSSATEVVAPPPVMPFPPPLPVAPVARTGDDPTAGSAQVAGPGYGAGGEGDGTGSGGYGNGPGGGGGGGRSLQLMKGRITDDDYPEAAIAARASGTVGLRFVVGIDGRVADCRVTRSSGNAALDETTCRLIQSRFRYRPSVDARGRPYADTVTGYQDWDLKERMAGPDED